MTKTEVLDLLKENRDARGEANWKEMGDRTGGLTSFGIGLTKLRAIAKQVGRDHDLALKLWNERNHDAKIIGLLIDESIAGRVQRSRNHRSSAAGLAASRASAADNPAASSNWTSRAGQSHARGRRGSRQGPIRPAAARPRDAGGPQDR
jgi:hypothetical protein